MKDNFQEQYILGACKSYYEMRILVHAVHCRLLDETKLILFRFLKYIYVFFLLGIFYITPHWQTVEETYKNKRTGNSVYIKVSSSERCLICFRLRKLVMVIQQGNLNESALDAL